MTNDKRARVNHRIRARQVRLIDSDGAQLGIVDIREARQVAEDRGLDLVEVAPNSDPPVCRVMDFGKYLYQEKKKQQDAKRKQKVYQIKEVKFRPTIGDHDYKVKMKHLLGFLEDGDKVKVTIQFRGREMARMDLGFKLLERVVGDVGDLGMVESPPERAGRRVHQVIAPPRKGTGGRRKASAPPKGSQQQQGGSSDSAAGDDRTDENDEE